MHIHLYIANIINIILSFFVIKSESASSQDSSATISSTSTQSSRPKRASAGSKMFDFLKSNKRSSPKATNTSSAKKKKYDRPFELFLIVMVLYTTYARNTGTNPTFAKMRSGR